MNAKTLLVVSVALSTASCGILSTRYVNYQAEGNQNGGGGIAFCQAAVDAMAIGFTSEACSCHGTTAPTVSGDSNVDRLTFLNLSDTKYAGDPAELVAYLKTDHSGASSVTGEAATGLDDWAISEKDSTICPPSETESEGTEGEEATAEETAE